VEMLGRDAYHILSRVGNIIDLKDTTNLRWLLNILFPISRNFVLFCEI
jgi:hypothetical protein